ncbi:hypothetical protein [Nocardiopsis suaedae]|uniref:Yip1 domain-containing protein n=1 Tax=Nocardiopsis suaedae TaxID=3018444 RepID=A0ABT4TS97_9ACTN|nr:hypothetical protein [Nocardiopsis suaedae]MDA2807548.1 hypothetical protein [Nocardiopsis suaedae]
MAVVVVQDVGFWEAVGLWWNGQRLEGSTMYGLPVLWWARIGKCLQFLGGAVVVIDLIGPERMLRQSDKIREARQVGGYWVDTFFEESPSEVSGRIQSFLGTCLGVALYVSPMLILLIIMVPAFEVYDLLSPTPLWETPIFVIFFILAPLALIAVFVSIVTFGRVVLAVFSLLGKVLEIGRHAYLARWLAFLLIIVGFHLDLLGS